MEKTYLITFVAIFLVISISIAAYLFLSHDGQKITGYFSKSVPHGNKVSGLASSNQVENDNYLEENPENLTDNMTETINATVSQVNLEPSVRINELMYNPSGSDDGNEWIELYNNGTVDLNVSGWKLFEDDVRHRVIIYSGNYTIPRNSYFIITSDGERFLQNHPSYNSSVFRSSFSLSNSGEYLALMDSSGKITDNFTYSSSFGGNGNGMSIEFHDNGWAESSISGGTPGTFNSIPVIVVANITNVSYAVNLCAGVTCPIKSQVCEDGFTVSCSPLCNNSTGSCDSCNLDCSGHFIINNNTSGLNSSNETAANTTENITTNQTNETVITNESSSNQTISLSHVVISEFTTRGPNGSSDEFVEVYNPTNYAIDITGWKLQYQSASGSSWDSKVGSGLNGTIGPNSFYLLASKSYSLNVTPDYRHTANWGFADTGGHIRIIYINGSEIDKVGYGSALSPEGNPAPAPGDGKSLQRVSLQVDSDDNLHDFEINDHPSPQN